MSLQLHRRDDAGGLEPRTAAGRDWRLSLRSSRWKVPALRNPEVNPTGHAMTILFWGGLAIATFALLLLGYGTGFWA